MKDISMKRVVLAFSVLIVALGGSLFSAAAKPARCFTSDDGQYACIFKSVDNDGSFEISAKGYPTYILSMSEPGKAWGFLNMGDRKVSLPGLFEREAQDRACWRNTDTDVRICAW